MPRHEVQQLGQNNPDLHCLNGGKRVPPTYDDSIRKKQGAHHHQQLQILFIGTTSNRAWIACYTCKEVSEIECIHAYILLYWHVL